MTANSHAMTFFGYWREQNMHTLPEQAGIFCVHAGIHNTHTRTVSVRKLIFIGESENIGQHIGCCNTQAWMKYLKKGETLCFSFAPQANYRAQCTTALIFEHKPPENIEHMCSFPFEQTHIVLNGKTDLLKTNFTVYQSSLQMLTQHFIKGLHAKIGPANHANNRVA